MSELLKIMSYVFSGLAFIQIPIMIFVDKVTGNYWTDIWNSNANVEPRAQGIFVLLVLSFLTIVAREILDYYTEKKVVSNVESEK